MDVTVTYLEMGARPSFDRPSLPSGPVTALLAAEAPPAWFFLDLYRAVGRQHYWTDLFAWPEAKITAWIQDPSVRLYTLYRRGWPAGFFLLDWREHPICDLAYFGLVPEVLGQGLGRYLLQTAIHTAWDLPGVTRMTVNTCTLDHPRALPLYQRQGFVPYRQATRPGPDAGPAADATAP